MNKRIISAVAVVVLAFLYGSQGQAQDPFYKGKTITILAGTGAGNVYDIFVRLFAHHLGKQPDIPGTLDFSPVEYVASGKRPYARRFIPRGRNDKQGAAEGFLTIATRSP
jgi:tripartite-type tricarboxylate transporter receptor subunit TctC